MNEIKPSTPSHQENRILFWGTIVMAILLTLLAGYFASVLARQLGPVVTYVGLAVFLLAPAIAVTSIVLVIRHKQELATKLSFYATIVMGIMSVALFQGRALSASLSVLVISLVAIRWLLPSQSRRQHIAVVSVAMIAMWVLEWINPSWRIQMQAARLGPVAAGLFVLILGVLVFLQARTVIASRFLSLSLRAKLLTSIVSITTLSLLIYGAIFYYRTQQSQSFWSHTLQTTVQQQSQQQITDLAQFQAHTADQALSEITLSVQQLADYRTSLFSPIAVLGDGGYWDANTKLAKRAAGQYVNATSDPASVFIPNTVSLSPELMVDINQSMYLDFSAPSVLKQNTNVVAIYYVGKDNYTVYYPNIDLASAVPADFDARTQSFYVVATPQNNPEGKPVWTKPYQDPAGTGLIVTSSVPVYNKSGQFRGVMSADVQLSKVAEEISTVKVGKTGFAFLIDPEGHVIAMPAAGYTLFGITEEIVPVGETPKTTILGLGSSDLQDITQQMVDGKNGLATATIEDTEYYVSYAPLPAIGYSLGLIAPVSELDATYLAARETIQKETQATASLSILVLLVVLIMAAGISLFLGSFLSTPLKKLTETAAEAAKGNLQAKAEVHTNDEIGLLASTFNTMTSRLQEILGSLEQRVAERTRNLELATEVGRTVSQVRNLDEMLKDACELILKEFNLYYVQVYLSDPSQTTLKLEAGTGSVAEQLLERGHSLSFDTSSINGRAAVEKHSVVISDTAQSATFRQNSLLPETRGEMAVPLMVANKVVGVLDMQSRSAGVLNNEILPAFEALAGQLAVAIQNANLLAETEQARAEVEKQARRLVRTSWNEHLDAIHKPEQIGYVFSQRKITPFVDADETPMANAVSSSISVTGETLGSLVVEIDDASRKEQAEDLVKLVARQVAQQIENLRLLESAERYRYEAEAASRRITREGWQEFADKTAEGLSFSYNLNEVRPQNGDAEQQMDGYALPLKVREEPIGKLIIQGLDTNDTESLTIASTVAERLSAHIEGLRQFQQTQSALSQSEKMFQASSVLNQAKALSEITASTVDLMGIAAINRALLVSFNYDNENNVDSLDVIANWWNGTGHEITPVGTHYSQQVIRVMQMFVSPVPVFFNDTHIDPRVDAKTMELVKRLNLRAVAVLPLHAGTQQIGALILEAEEPHTFTHAETRLFSALAPQIATVLDNRLQYERAQRQADRESKLNAISQKIQSATTVEAVLQIAARELGHTLGAPLTIAQLGLKDNAKSN